MMAADMLQTPGFFSAAIAAENENNPFEASFMDIEQTKQEFLPTRNLDCSSFFQVMGPDSYTPLFGFSPQASQGPVHSSQQPLNLWSSSRQPKLVQYPNPLLRHQAPSPPMSVQSSPENWDYSLFQPQQPMMTPHKIHTANHPSDSCIQYGQVTPPDDRTPDDYQYEAQPKPQVSSTEPVQSGKRKRASQSSVESVKPSKRSRKSSGRSKTSCHDSQVTNPLNPEDEKRSKFLERNRVAASKCRQKKKEWTGNLEARARELQNNKNQLAVIVNSLKEEVIFLKGEMLKHTSCGCERVRDYLEKKADSITSANASPPQPFWSAASPVQSAPGSKSNSISGSASNHSSRSGSTALSGEEKEPVTPPPMMHFKSENELEALLTSSLLHDTSEEGITQRAGR